MTGTDHVQAKHRGGDTPAAPGAIAGVCVLSERRHGIYTMPHLLK